MFYIDSSSIQSESKFVIFIYNENELKMFGEIRWKRQKNN